MVYEVLPQNKALEMNSPPFHFTGGEFSYLSLSENEESKGVRTMR